MNEQNIYLGSEPVPGLRRIARGKVRDVYALDDERLLFVTTDRVSAFDVVMAEGVPYKGAVLTSIAAWWFEGTRDVVANHLLGTSIDDVPGLPDEWRELLAGRIMIVRRARPTPVEWVVRGYLAGSGWKDYQRQGSISGVPLPAGLVEAQRLPEPILTPTTKDDVHDLPISPAEARERVGDALFEAAERASLALFRRGTEVLERIGFLLADTKLEFGTLPAPEGTSEASAGPAQAGELILIDELLTPDSSRFWQAADWRPGRTPPSYDKQILRDWLETLDWNKKAPPPPLEPGVVQRLSERYLEVCERITGAVPVGVRP